MERTRAAVANPSVLAVFVMAALYPLLLLFVPTALLGASLVQLSAGLGGLAVGVDWLLALALGLGFGFLLGKLLASYPIGQRLWLIGLSWAVAFVVATIVLSGSGDGGFGGGVVTEAPAGIVLPVFAALGLWLARSRAK